MNHNRHDRCNHFELPASADGPLLLWPRWATALLTDHVTPKPSGFQRSNFDGDLSPHPPVPLLPLFLSPFFSSAFVFCGWCAARFPRAVRLTARAADGGSSRRRANGPPTGGGQTDGTDSSGTTTSSRRRNDQASERAREAHDTEQGGHRDAPPHTAGNSTRTHTALVSSECAFHPVSCGVTLIAAAALA